jgi:peroxiredoxin
MQDFVDRHGLQVTNIADVEGVVWEQFGVVAQPAWVFIDGETGTAERVLGALPPDELQARLDALEG